MKRVLVAGLLGFLAAPCFASAQEVQTYTYDVHGRLVTVVRTGSNAMKATAYEIDDADNRLSRDVAAPAAAASANPPAASASSDAAAPTGNPAEPTPTNPQATSPVPSETPSPAQD